MIDRYNVITDAGIQFDGLPPGAIALAYDEADRLITPAVMFAAGQGCEQRTLHAIKQQVTAKVRKAYGVAFLLNPWLWFQIARMVIWIVQLIYQARQKK